MRPATLITVSVLSACGNHACSVRSVSVVWDVFGGAHVVNKRVHILISGKVHGVGFRICTVDQAEASNLTGWVRNREDGKVEIVAEGEEGNIDAFLQWCKTGPDSAAVSGVKTVFSEATGEYDSFSIRYGSAARK